MIRKNLLIILVSCLVFLATGLFPFPAQGAELYPILVGLYPSAELYSSIDEINTYNSDDFTYNYYCLNKPVSQAQMAVFLLRAKYGYTYSPPPASGGSFTDVADHWAEARIEQLATEGFTSGYPDGTYRPEQLVIQGQMAVFLVKTFDLPRS